MSAFPYDFMAPQLLMSSGRTSRVAGFVYGMSAKLQVSVSECHHHDSGVIEYRSAQNRHTHCKEFRQLHDRLLKDVGDSGPSIVRVRAQLLLIKKSCRLEVLRACKLLEEISAITLVRFAIDGYIATCCLRSYRTSTQ